MLPSIRGRVARPVPLSYERTRLNCEASGRAAPTVPSRRRRRETVLSGSLNAELRVGLATDGKPAKHHAILARLIDHRRRRATGGPACLLRVPTRPGSMPKKPS